MTSIVSDGYTVLKDVIPADALQAALSEFNRDYMASNKELSAKVQQIGQRRSVMEVGTQRYLMTVELSGAFASKELYGNTSVLAACRDALGTDFVLDSFGVVLALPGAEDQHLHRDSPGLFDIQLNRMLPPYSLTVGIPLVDVTEEVGPTMLWPGSHRAAINSTKEFQESPIEAGKIALTVQQGDVTIWDYRLWHRGLANQSDTSRPLLFMTYCRPWFRDVENYRKQNEVKSQLIVADGFLESVPDDRRFLFNNLDRSRSMA